MQTTSYENRARASLGNYKSAALSHQAAWEINRALERLGVVKTVCIYALDYNCHPSGALASWLYRSHWRRPDPSLARDCCHCARYSTDSRQTALSEFVFPPPELPGCVGTLI